MKLGIIGLQGSGKTTIFEALTKNFQQSGAKAEDRIGTIQVPDERVDSLSRHYNPRKTIYAQVEYFLPGATVKSAGASDTGSWANARDCDALIHCVRNFNAYGLEPASPAADFTALDQDIILADFMVASKRLERMELDAKRGKKIQPEEISLLKDCLTHLENSEPLRHYPELATAHILRGFAFLSAKPILTLFNNEDNDDGLPGVADAVDLKDGLVIRGKLEQELSQMSEEEALEFLEEFNITASATDRVVKRSYEILGLVSFFTVGEDEVRAWTINKDTPAVDAAEVIHSDIKQGFIRAEVLHYDDLMEAGTYAEARKKGTVRLEGKTYPVKNGDIINFRFNV